MPKFKEFAEQVNSIAIEARKQVQAVEKEQRIAEEERARYPRNGGKTPEFLAKSARAEADFQTAIAKMDDLRRVLPVHVGRQLREVRGGLEKAIDETFSARPEDIEPDTITLLESGILRPGEYNRLLDRAIQSGNFTMVRMIGAAAEKAGKETEKIFGQSDEAAKAFRAVGYTAQRVGGEVYRTNFRTLEDVLRRCLNNPALWDRWEALTGEIIEQGF